MEHNSVFNTSEMDSFLLCGSFTDFPTVLQSVGSKNIGKIFKIRAILFGPVLWPLCILGMVFNAVVFLACFFKKFTSSSIILGSICAFSIIHASFMLLLHDMDRGSFVDSNLFTRYCQSLKNSVPSKKKKEIAAALLFINDLVFRQIVERYTK